VRYVAGHSTGYVGVENEEAMCDRYLAGESVEHLCSAFEVRESTVYRVLKRNGVELWGKGSPTEAQQSRICERYLDGERAHAIATGLGIGKSTVLRVLEKHGVVRRDRSDARRRYTCDDHFFDVIDSESKAYWLGFIAADGCVTGKNSLSIGLQARDREHLERLKNALDATNPITMGRTSSGFPTATLFVTSPALTAGLEGNGIVRRKSKTLEWPRHLDASLLRHYLRGYFDGDGWFSVSCSGYVRKSDGQRSLALSWGIIGTDSFCADAQDFLVRGVGVRRVGLHSHWATAGMSTLTYGGNVQVSRIYWLLYDDARVWLPRKRHTARSHVRDYRQTRPRPEARALSDTDLEEAESLRETGLSYREVASRLGVSERTVSNALKRGYHTLS